MPAPLTLATAPLPFAGVTEEFAAPGQTLRVIADGLTARGVLSPRLIRAGLIVCTVNNRPVPQRFWHAVRPKPGTRICFALRPAGGGQKGGKNVLRVVMMLAVVAIAAWAGPTAATAMGLKDGAFTAVSTVVSAVTSYALNSIVNAIAPLPQPGSREKSSNYALTGGQNRADPYGPAVVVFGRHRVYGKIAARYFTRAVGDKVRLVGVIQWHVGKCQITELKIGDALASTFANCTFQHRLLGQSYASQISICNELVQEDASAVPVEIVGGISEGALTPLPEHGWVTRSFPRRAERLSFDIAFPNGLNEDGTNAWTVRAQAQYRKKGDASWTLVPQSANAGDMTAAGEIEFTENTRDMVRRTFAWTPPAGAGEYELRVRRWTYEPGLNVSDTIYIVAVRAHRDGLPVLDDNLCITAFEVQASDQLNGTLETLNAIVEPIIPVRSGGNWASEATSRNPAAIFRWLHTGPALAAPARLTAARLVGADLDAWFDACATDGLECNYVLDTDMSALDAGQLIANCGNAGPVWQGGRRSVVRDVARPAENLFTAATVRNFKSQIVWPEFPHALRVGFVNAEQGYAPDEIIVYAPGFDELTAVNIQAVEVPGRVTAAAVWRAARRILRRAWLRNVITTFEVDFQFLTSACRFGARALADHHALRRETRPARVTALATSGANVTGVTLDEAVTFRAGQSYALQCHRVSDGALRLVSLTNPASGADVVTAVLTFASAQTAANAPDLNAHVNFGNVVSLTDDVQIIDVQPQDDMTAAITVVPYADSLFDDDTATPPVFASVAFPPIGSVGAPVSSGGVPGAPDLGGFTLGQIF